MPVRTDRPVRLTRIPALLATLALGALWLLAAPLVSAGDPCYHDFAMPPASTGTATQIKVADCAFLPTVNQVAVGATVTFLNGPDFVHLITGANQAWGSRDVELKPNARVSYTFTKAGIYPYACALHRGMSGTIVVGDAATALAAGTGVDPGAASGGSTTTGTTTTAGETASTAATGGTAPAVVAASAAAGAMIGAAVIWLAMRRRHTDQERVTAVS
jgi:plastocyanin